MVIFHLLHLKHNNLHKITAGDRRLRCLSHTRHLKSLAWPPSAPYFSQTQLDAFEKEFLCCVVDAETWRRLELSKTVLC